MKKIRRARVFLFLAAAFISGCLCSLTANAAVKSKNKIVVQEYSTAQKNAGELRIGILVSIFLIALILGFLGFWITRWLINRKTLGESNKKYGKKYSYKFKAPKDISEAASGKIKKSDPAFDISKFLLFTENTAKRLVTASSSRDIDFLRENENTVLFGKHRELLREGNILSAQDDIKSLSADMIKITEYHTGNNTETITAYLKCSVSRSSCKTERGTPCDILLSFKRPRGTKSTDFSDGICTSCGADVPPSLPRCPKCNSIAKFNTNGWQLIDFDDLTY